MKEGEPRYEDKIPQKSPDAKEPKLEKIASSGQDEHAKQKRAFQLKEQVWVQRSSGEIETGWQVHGYNGDNVVVRKTDKSGKVLEKEISEGELSTLRDEKTKEIRKISGI